MASVSFRADVSATGSTLSTDQENSNERLGENVMSMEFAIKREVAYRMKMEKLQSRGVGMPARSLGSLLHVCGRCLSEYPAEKSKILQVLPGPNPSLVGMKRKAPASNTQCSPMQPQTTFSRRPLQKQLDSLFCKVCQVACSSTQSLKQHRQGSKHINNLENFVESNQGRRENGTKQMWCKICRVPCSDDKAYAQHLAGKKHAAVVSLRLAKEEAQREVSVVKWDELEWEMV